MKSALRSCPQCGASVELPPERIASPCAFCASALVDSSAIRESIDRVAPFDVRREHASGLLARHLQDRWLLPESLRQAGRPEGIHGVLVPFWCYDASARSTWEAKQGIHWYRTETYTTFEDGKPVTKTRTVRETEWFRTDGSHVASYVDHLVSGSKGLSEPESNELEPFDLGRALPFRPELLAGWIAEQPTVARSQAVEVAAQELADVENRAIRDFLPADEVKDVTNDTSIQVGELELVLLPVWIATYSHEDSVLRLLVNGQTGEVVSPKLPKSWAKILGLVAAFLAVAGIGTVGVLVLASLLGAL